MDDIAGQLHAVQSKDVHVRALTPNVGPWAVWQYTHTRWSAERERKSVRGTVHYTGKHTHMPLKFDAWVNV